MPSGTTGDRCGLILPLAFVAAVLLLPAGTLLISASRHAGGGAELVSREVFLMGTRAVLSTWSESRHAGLERLEHLLRALEDTEAQLSTWRTDSEVSTLNAAAGSGTSVLSPSLCEAMKTVDRWTRETNRAFDASIGALIAAWDLHGRGRVPSPRRLEAARRRSGWDRLTFDRSACTLTMPTGMSLDVGGFGKGDALDRARLAVKIEWPWLIDLGGQVAVAGAPPNANGWDISVAHPRLRDSPALRLRVTTGSLATSAGSERDLRVGGRRIGHILDPRTGRPATFTGSTTVWHQQALVADVLSTALFVMGPEEGVRWADAHNIAAVYLLPGPRGTVIRRASRAFDERFAQ